MTQMISSRVLPWIGAPSLLLARAHAELDHAVDRDRHDEHEDRHRDDQQDVVQRVDLVRLRESADCGNQWMSARSRCR